MEERRKSICPKLITQKGESSFIHAVVGAENNWRGAFLLADHACGNGEVRPVHNGTREAFHVLILFSLSAPFLILQARTVGTAMGPAARALQMK